MRDLKFAFAIAVAVLGTWYLTAFGFEAIVQTRQVTASSANESPFLQVFRPDESIKHFYVVNQPCTSGGTNSGTSDVGYVHHGLNWETTCVIQADLEREFANAIRAEISRSVAVTHSRVKISGDTYQYRSGKSAGRVTVETLEAASQSPPLPAGLVNVHIRLTVTDAERVVVK